MAFGPPLSGPIGPIQQVLTPPGITPLPSPGLYGPYVGVTNPIFHAAPFGAYPVVPVAKASDAMQPRPIQKRAHDGESELFCADNIARRFFLADWRQQTDTLLRISLTT